MEFYITSPKDYWIAPTAVNISLNALSDPNRMQGSVSSGAVISCYIEGVEGLGLDNGRNPKRWALSLSPTYFNSNTAKYVYVAIPRSSSVGTQAVVVFPSEKLDIYGKNAEEVQVGSSDYYYVWLQGILSSSGQYGEVNREWTAEIDFGSLGTYEDIIDMTETDWYTYSKVNQIVTFLKPIFMKAGSYFQNLILGNKELTGVATGATSEEYVDSETLVVTPSYINGKYLRKDVEDTAQEQIGFLKGLWIGIKGLYEITADGMAKFKSLFVDDITTQRMQVDDMQSSNYTGDGIADTGWRLTKDYNGHSKLTVDELYVRMKAVFESLEIKKEMVTGGNQIFSRAANVICRTDYFDANGDRIGYSEVKVPWLLRGLSMVLSKRILSGIYAKVKPLRISISDPTEIAYIRCYFLAEEGGRKVNNLWSVTNGHDLARCQTFNLNRSERKTYVDGEDVKLGNVFWWRKVIAVSSNSNPVEIDGKKYHYFDVSNQSGGYMDGSDLPCAGDEVSQWGNDGNEDRMNLVTIEVDGAVAIKAYEGIYTFDMSKCWYGGNPCKMNLSPQNEYRFTGRKFKIETEYGVRPVPVDIDVDWASQTKSRAEYAETGISMGQLIVKNYYYDRLPHNGSLWLCLFTGNAYWARYAQYVNGVISYVTEDVFNTLPDSKKLYVRVSGRTGLADNQVCRRMEYTAAEPGTNSAVWHQEVAKGQNGIDAQDVEWVYIRTKTNVAPVILSDSTYTDSNGNDYTADDHLPRVNGNANIENNHDTYECTDDPKGVDDTWKYEWEIKRSKGAASDGHRAWNYYQGAMTLHGNFAESAFIIDTDNDNDQFGTDSESIVLVTQTRQTVVSLYDGSTQQSLTNLTAVLTFDDGTSVPSTVAEVSTMPATGMVEVTVKQNSTANTHSEIRANITATCAKGSKQTVFTLRKVMGGAPGLNPIIYQLAPTVKAFPFARTSTNALTPNSQVSQINVSRTEGNTTTILTTAQTGITYQWGFDDSTTPEETNKSVGSTITVNNAQAALHSKVWIKLSTGDRETLPIVKDGAKGDPGNNGDTPVQAFQWNQSPTTAPSPLPSGSTLGDWSLTAPNRPSGDGEYFLWMTQTVKHTAADGTVTYDAWSAAVRISGNTGQTGPQGPDGNDGEDGVTLLISPASLIVNQDLNNPDNLSNLTQTFVVMVYKGSVAQSVNGIGFTAETVPSSNPTAYKGLFLNNSSQRVGSGNVNGNILTLKQINTYTQGQQTLYYDNFFADLVVNYGNLKTISGRVRIYANLLGTWKQTIEGDVSTEMAQRIAYLYDPNNPNQVVKQTNYAEFVRSSTEAINTLQGDVYDQQGHLALTTKTELKQTTDAITSTVKANTGNRNLFGFTACSFGVATNDCGYPAIQSYGMLLRFVGDTDITGRLARVAIPSLETGKTYTLSCQIKMTSSAAHIEIDLGDTSGGLKTIEATTEWQNIEVQLLFNNISHPEYKWIDFGIIPADYVAGNYALLRHVKLEAGELATAFCIANEDINSVTNVRPVDAWTINDNMAEDSTVTCPSGKKVYKTLALPSAPSGQADEYIDYISANGLTSIETGKVYTISYWVMSSANNTHRVTTYMYPDLTPVSQDFLALVGDDSQSERIAPDCVTEVGVTTEWEKHYIHIYVMALPSGGSVNCLPLRLTRHNGSAWNTQGTLYISDIQLCEGYVTEDNNTVNESYSSIKQTAKEIDLSVRTDLAETGINISGESKSIHMTAQNTIIDSDVAVGSLETISDSSRVRIKDGIAEFFGVAGIANIRIGLDSQGCAILNFYDNSGNLVYGLGPNDLPSQLNSKASFFTATALITAFDVTLPAIQANINNMAAKNTGFNTYYLFTEGYSAVNNVKTYLISRNTTPSSYNQKTYDTDGRSSNIDADWHPTGTEITDGYYIGEAMENGNYSGSASSLYKCRNVYHVAYTGAHVIFVGILYYRYENNKAYLTNMAGTVVYSPNSSKMILNYLNGEDPSRPGPSPYV